MSGPAQFNLRLASGQEFGPATLELIEQWTRAGRVPVDALLVPINGSPVRSVMSEPSIRALQRTALLSQTAAAPPTSPGPVTAPADGGTAVMIPYKNAPALIGYYMAVAALIPGLGLVAGPVAVVLGIVGLRKRLKHPEVHGIVHAWIAIILGGLCFLGYGAIMLLMIAAANS
jgi:hypothetical protein